MKDRQDRCPVCLGRIRLGELMLDHPRDQMTADDLYAVCDRCASAWSSATWRKMYPYQERTGPTFRAWFVRDDRHGDDDEEEYCPW